MMAHLVLEERLEVQDNLVSQGHLDHRDLGVLLESVANQVHQVLLVSVVKQDLMEDLAVQVHVVRVDNLDHLAHLVQLDKGENLDKEVVLEREESQVQMVHQGKGDHQDQMVLVGHLALEVNLDLRVAGVNLDQLDQGENVGNKGLQVQQVYRPIFLQHYSQRSFIESAQNYWVFANW